MMVREKLFCLVLFFALVSTGCALFPPLEADRKNAEPMDRAVSGSVEETGQDRKDRSDRDGLSDQDRLPDGSRDGLEGMSGASDLTGDASAGSAASLDGLMGAAGLLEEPPGDRVLARAAGQEIRASDLYQIYFLDNPIKARRMVQDLVLYALVREEAARLGIEVEKKEVEERLDGMIRDQQGRIALSIDEELSLDEFVRDQYGMEMTAYRDLLRRSALFQALLERCVRYRELTVRRLQVGVILFQDRNAAERVHRKLMKGANFDVLARENAADSSDPQGGVLPPLPADMNYPVIQDSLALGLGEISEVIETRVGKEKFYRIIKLVEILEPLKGSYKELRNQIEDSLKTQPLVIPDLVDYWLESVDDRYDLEITMP